jgi:hypothetical protein
MGNAIQRRRRSKALIAAEIQLQALVPCNSIQLVSAVKDGNENAVFELLKAGEMADTVENVGLTAPGFHLEQLPLIFYPIASGNERLAEMLVLRGCPDTLSSRFAIVPPYHYETPGQSSGSATSSLEDDVGPVSATMVEIASFVGYVPVMQQLLRCDKAVLSPACLAYAVYRGKDGMVDFIAHHRPEAIDALHNEKGSPVTALGIAAGRGHLSIVELLLRLGAKPTFSSPEVKGAGCALLHAILGPKEWYKRDNLGPLVIFHQLSKLLRFDAHTARAPSRSAYRKIIRSLLVAGGRADEVVQRAEGGESRPLLSWACSIQNFPAVVELVLAGAASSLSASVIKDLCAQLRKVEPAGFGRPRHRLFAPEEEGEEGVSIIGLGTLQHMTGKLPTHALELYQTAVERMQEEMKEEASFSSPAPSARPSLVAPLCPSPTAGGVSPAASARPSLVAPLGPSPTAGGVSPAASARPSLVAPLCPSPTAVGVSPAASTRPSLLSLPSPAPTRRPPAAPRMSFDPLSTTKAELMAAREEAFFPTTTGVVPRSTKPSPAAAVSSSAADVPTLAEPAAITASTCNGTAALREEGKEEEPTMPVWLEPTMPLLFFAIKSRNLAVVRSLVAAGCQETLSSCFKVCYESHHHHDEEDQFVTMTDLAAFTGDTAIMERLLKCEATVLSKQTLMYAAYGGNNSMVELIANDPRFPGFLDEQALGIACSRGHTSTVELLVRLGAQPTPSALEAAVVLPAKWYCCSDNPGSGVHRDIASTEADPLFNAFTRVSLLLGVESHNAKPPSRYAYRKALRALIASAIAHSSASFVDHATKSLLPLAYSSGNRPAILELLASSASLSWTAPSTLPTPSCSSHSYYFALGSPEEKAEIESFDTEILERLKGQGGSSSLPLYEEALAAMERQLAEDKDKKEKR